ncbi:hypothetical protein J2T13_005390 [Paenibacillus sp. DS2015]
MAEPPGPTVLKPFGRQECATLYDIGAKIYFNKSLQQRNKQKEQ